MERVLRWGLAGLLAACASTPEVRVEYDRSAPFATYRTFAFATPLATDRAAGDAGAVSRYLSAATRRELEARGLRHDAAAPDLRVNFSARLSERTQVARTVPPGNYYGYRSGVYSTWPTYAWADAPPLQAPGTLHVDVFDVARKQLVWEGIVSGVLSDDALADPRPAIDAAIAAAFARYPQAAK